MSDIVERLRISADEFHRAPLDGPLHYEWTDKPHRLLYDAKNLFLEAASEIESLRARISPPAGMVRALEEIVERTTKPYPTTMPPEQILAWVNGKARAIGGNILPLQKPFAAMTPEPIVGMLANIDAPGEISEIYPRVHSKNDLERSESFRASRGRP